MATVTTVVTNVTDAVKAPLAPKNRQTVIIIIAIALGVWWFFFRNRRARGGAGEEDFAPVIGGGGGGGGGGIDEPVDDTSAAKDFLSDTEGDPGSIGVPLDPRFLGELKDAVVDFGDSFGSFSAGDTGGAASDDGFSSGQLSFIEDLQQQRTTSTLGDQTGPPLGDPITEPKTLPPPKQNIGGALETGGGGLGGF